MRAFIFPGQGAQYVGMGKDLYDTFTESKRIFDIADGILDFSISKLCFNGPIEELTRTVNCQPAIFVVSIAAFAALNKQINGKRDLMPEYMAGLSLGEYSALVAAGAISFKQGLSLVASRARFMHEAAEQRSGQMASILGLSLDKIKEIAQATGVEVANLNCPGQVVISGTTQAIQKAHNLALQSGARRVVILDVSGAFHSSLMQPASEKLKERLDAIEVKKPQVTVISNVSALPEDKPNEIKDNLIRQLTSSVLWECSIRLMIQQGIDKFLEIGPGKVLKGLIRKINPDIKVFNIEKREDILGNYWKEGEDEAPR